MATLPYFQNAGRANLTPEQVRLLEPLFQSMQQGSGDSMEFTKQADPYAYAQQSPDFQSLAIYDPQGNYLGDDARNHESGDKNLMKFLLTAAAMYGGGQLLGGESAALGGGAADAGMGAGGAGVEAGGAATGAGQMTVADLGINSIPGVQMMTGNVAPLATADFGLMNIPSVGGMAGPAANAAANYSNEGRNYPTSASTQGSGGSPFNASAVAAAAGDLPWKNILGAGLGALSSQDQTQSAQREPWGPSQDFLKGLLGQGQALSQRLAAEPFTGQQQAAYNNIGSLLNTINGGAQGLLQGAQANASGANNYDRSNPRKALLGSNFSLNGFSPQLLSFFGGK